MFLMDSFLRLTKNSGYRGLRQAADNPQRVQTDYLKRLLKQNATTAFGRDHDFSSIGDIDSFREKVPVRGSADYRPLLDSVYRGKSSELIQHPTLFFSMTSGTDQGHHFIPINKPMEKDIARAFSTFYYFLEHQLPDLQQGRIQFLVGSGLGGDSPSGVSQGFLSGWSDQNDLRKTHRGSVIPNWVFTLENDADRYYAMARYMVEAPDIMAIGSYSPECIINVAKLAEERSNALIRDLENGTLILFHDYPQMPKQLKLGKHPELAGRIKALHDGFNTIPASRRQEFTQLLFPSLCYVLTWMSAGMDFTVAELHNWYSKITLFELPTIASEGVIAIPFEPSSKGGILAANSHFFEFIPEAAADSKAPETKLLWELQNGQRYYVVLTTSAGLYRYNLEDLVEVTGFWGVLPVIQLAGTRTRAISIEERFLTEADVARAVTDICRSSGISLRQFVLTPDPDKDGWKLLVEGFNGDLQQFANQLAAQLKTFFSADRALTVAEVADSALTEYVRSKQKGNGLPNAQYKPLHLSTNPQLCNGFKITRTVVAMNRGEANGADAARQSATEAMI